MGALILKAKFAESFKTCQQRRQGDVCRMGTTRETDKERGGEGDSKREALPKLFAQVSSEPSVPL